MVSFLTAPTLPLPPATSSSLAKPGCHLFRLSKSLTVAQTLSMGALISTVSVTRIVFGGSAPPASRMHAERARYEQVFSDIGGARVTVKAFDPRRFEQEEGRVKRIEEAT